MIAKLWMQNQYVALRKELLGSPLRHLDQTEVRHRPAPLSNWSSQMPRLPEPPYRSCGQYSRIV